MGKNASVTSDWDSLISNLSKFVDLDATARESGALKRRRSIADGARLLRLALAYGPGALSLRSAAAWAGINDVACLCDVGLLKRLRGAADWLGLVAGAMLQNVAGSIPASGSRPLRIVDDSSISRPGSKGTDWRVQATYNPAYARFTHLELSDVHGGEGFVRVPLCPGDIVFGDRAYARAPAFHHAVSADADFIVRMAWSNVRLTSPGGDLINWNTIYEALEPGAVCAHDALIAYCGPGSKHRGKPLLRARLIVRRKDEEATTRAMSVARRRHQKPNGNRQMHPLSVTTSGFLLLLASLPASEMTADEVWDTYRMRWQIEMAFKRLKSGSGFQK